MESQKLADLELEAVLLQVIQQAYKEYKPIAAAYDLLYQTGCRFNEITYLSEWELTNNDQAIRFMARKNKKHREIPITWLSEKSTRLIESGGILIHRVSYGRARDFMRQILSSKYMTCGDKKLYLHAFRHNFARKLHRTGHSLPEIQTIMGLKSLSVASGYVFNPILQRR